MPINFQTTFTEPLLLKLDSGVIKDSKDLAKSFTDFYVATLLTGTPQGTPPTLPAPGLGTPPPAYPIVAVPIINYQQRQKAMTKVLEVYFRANEILNANADITGTIKRIISFVRNAKAIKQQITNLVKEAASIVKEIQQIPQLLENIKNAIGDIIKKQIDKLKLIFQELENFRLQTYLPDFESKFRDEIEIYQTLKNFKLSFNIRDYQVFARLLEQINFRLSYITEFNQGDNNEESAFKKFFYSQLLSSIRTLTNISNLLVSPAKFVDFFRDLVAVDRTLQPALAYIERFTFITNKLRPRLVKIRRFLTDKLNKLLDSVNAKINEEKEKLKEKRKALAEKRRGEGKISVFAKAGILIRKFKENQLQKIKNIIKTIALIKTIVRAGKQVINDAVVLYEDIEKFVESGAADYIKKMANDFGIGKPVVTNVSEQIETDLTGSIVNVRRSYQYYQRNETLRTNPADDMNRILNYAGITNPTIRNKIINQFNTKIITPNTLSNYLESKPADIQILFYSVRKLMNDAESLSSLLLKLMGKNDKPETILSSVKKNPDDIKGYDLDSSFQTFTIKKTPGSFLQSQETGPFVDQDLISNEQDYFIYKKRRTLKDVLIHAFTKVKLFIQKINKKLEIFVKDTTDRLQKRVSDFREQLNTMLIQLVPMSSKVTDKKNKKDVIEDKKRRLENWKRTLRLLGKISYEVNVNVIPSAGSLMSSFKIGELGYSSNKTNLDRLLDGVYNIRIIKLEAGPGTKESIGLQKEQIIKERDDKKQWMADYLGGLELFFNVFKKLQNELTKTDFIKRLGERIAELTKQGTQKDVQAYIDLYNVIRSIGKLPIIDAAAQGISMNEFFSDASLRNFSNDATNLNFSRYEKYNVIGQMITIFTNKQAFRGLEDSFIRTILSDLESTYLRETQSYVDQIVKNPIVLRLKLIEDKKRKEFQDLVRFKPSSVEQDRLNDELNAPGPDDNVDPSMITLPYQSSRPTVAVKKEEDKKDYNIIKLLFKGIKWLIDKIADFLKKIYTRLIKPIVSTFEDIYNKKKEQYLEWVRVHQVERSINKDAKFLSIALNVATKVFWTNFQWIAPDGTITRALMPQPFPMLEAKPDDGATAAIGEIARYFRIQLKSLTGTISPPPITGIPPQVFFGYR